jgi:hypothetical protein
VTVKGVDESQVALIGVEANMGEGNTKFDRL